MEPNKKALWKQMHSTESLWKTAQTVWQNLKPTGAHHPLSMVIAPNDLTGERYKCSQKAELEKACLAEASWHFTQAQQTPFLTSPLIDIFRGKGQTKVFEQVLAGTFQPPPTCDLYTAKFLAQLSRHQLLQRYSHGLLKTFVEVGKEPRNQLACRLLESISDITLLVPLIQKS